MNTKKISQEDLYNEIYQQLVLNFPDKPWQKPYLKLGKEPAIHQLGENLISYGLYLYDLNNLNKDDLYDRELIAEAMLYSKKIMEFYAALAQDKQAAFMGRWRAAFCEANDMRALIFEIFVYYILKNNGWDVEHKDDDNSKETYDYLASKHNKEIQIECKSFSYDKGLVINACEAYNISTNILNSGVIKNHEPKNELCLITIRINKKLPKNQANLSQICKEIAEYIKDDSGFQSDAFNIDIQRYNNVHDIHEEFPSILPEASDGIELFYTHLPPIKDMSRVCLRINAILSDSFWREFEKICRDAAKKQLIQNKPSALAIHISNIQLRKLILNDHRFLAKKASIFNQPHLVNMLFISNTGGYWHEEYPYCQFHPILDEFFNENSKFIETGNKENYSLL